MLRVGFDESRQIVNNIGLNQNISLDIDCDSKSCTSSVKRLLQEDEMDLFERQYSHCVDIARVFDEVIAQAKTESFFAEVYARFVLEHKKEARFYRFYDENKDQRYDQRCGKATDKVISRACNLTNQWHQNRFGTPSCTIFEQQNSPSFREKSVSPFSENSPTSLLAGGEARQFSRLKETVSELQSEGTANSISELQQLQQEHAAFTTQVLARHEQLQSRIRTLLAN